MSGSKPLWFGFGRSKRDAEQREGDSGDADADEVREGESKGAETRVDGSTLDLGHLESVFGLRGPALASPPSPRAAGATPRRSSVSQLDAEASSVHLLPPKRANNVEITLSRIKLSYEQIKSAILFPRIDLDDKDDGREGMVDLSGAMAPSAAASSPLMGSFGGEGSAGASTPRLTSENVSALLGLLPTAEELELIQGHCEATSTPASSLGRVEQFFLALGEIKHLEQRLRSMQATQGFGEQWSRLTAHVGSLREACKQVRHSAKLKHVLFLVLQIGNYLNGASTRGGAYGFKLCDLEKLKQVRSADQQTTLLHYLVKLPTVGSASWIKDLKEKQLPAVFAVRGLMMSELRAQLASLRHQFKTVETMRELLKKGAEPADAKVTPTAPKLASLKPWSSSSSSSRGRDRDPLEKLCARFCETRRTQLDALTADFGALDGEVRSLALWLAEPAERVPPAEELFGPVATFITDLERVHAEVLLEEARERRKSERRESARALREEAAVASSRRRAVSIRERERAHCSRPGL